MVRISLYYFPLGLRYTSIALLGLAGWLLHISYFGLAVVAILICVFVLTAQYVTTIDLEARRYIDAFTFYGIDIDNEKRSFNKINRIEVTKGNYSQKISTRSSDRQLDWADYTGTLIYDDIGELTLVTHEDKKQLMKTLLVYATALKCEIDDKSIGVAPARRR
jgi:hypothetical protein